MSWLTRPAVERRGVFPPQVRVQVTATACSLPKQEQVPLSFATSASRLGVEAYAQASRCCTKHAIIYPIGSKHPVCERPLVSCICPVFQVHSVMVPSLFKHVVVFLSTPVVSLSFVYTRIRVRK